MQRLDDFSRALEADLAYGRTALHEAIVRPNQPMDFREMILAAASFGSGLLDCYVPEFTRTSMRGITDPQDLIPAIVAHQRDVIAMAGRITRNPLAIALAGPMSNIVVGRLYGHMDKVVERAGLAADQAAA